MDGPVSRYRRLPGLDPLTGLGGEVLILAMPGQDREGVRRHKPVEVRGCESLTAKG